jgi:hypothetical protein
VFPGFPACAPAETMNPDDSTIAFLLIYDGFIFYNL